MLKNKNRHSGGVSYSACNAIFLIQIQRAKHMHFANAIHFNFKIKDSRMQMHFAVMQFMLNYHTFVSYFLIKQFSDIVYKKILLYIFPN